jgi:hypothetical protein
MQSTQQPGNGLGAIDPTLELTDTGAEPWIWGQMAIDVLHGYAKKPGTIRKRLLMFGSQSHVTHDVVEQIGPIGTKPIGDTTRTLGFLTEGNVFLLTLLLKVGFTGIGTNRCDTEILCNELPGDAAP